MAHQGPTGPEGGHVDTGRVPGSQSGLLTSTDPTSSAPSPRSPPADAACRVRYRGTAKDNAWLKRRTAALDLRNLIGRGLARVNGALTMATT